MSIQLDVVELLDQWRDYWEAHDELALRGLATRVRDEIVALRMERSWTHTADGKMKPVACVRAEALEEAAQYIERRYRDCGRTADTMECAAAIRRLAARAVRQ